MMSTNIYNGSDRSPKVGAPTSPQTKRKNIDFALHSPIPTPNNAAQYSRKDNQNLALSPNGHYYPQKQIQTKPLDQSVQREVNLEGVVRQLSDRVIKMSQKLGQHEAILIKITENSIENNKEQFRRNNQASRTDFFKINETLTENINRLRKDFQDFRSVQSNSRELEIKNTNIFDELIRRSQQKMRQQFQRIQNAMNSRALKQSMVPSGIDRVQQLQKTIKKMQKSITANSIKINGSLQRIQEVNTSIDGHMQLVNAEVNKAISKIVTFINQKISKPLNESVANLTERLVKIQTQNKAVNTQSTCHFAGYRSSTIRSQKSINRAQYRQILSAFNQQIIISENTYYIDSDGYLLDREYCYLVDGNSERIRLDQNQIKLLVSQRMLD